MDWFIQMHILEYEGIRELEEEETAAAMMGGKV